METLVINGTSYSFPDTGDENWGDDVTNWARAVSSGLLQKAGGSFTLTSEVDFGATYGAKIAYVKTESSNPAAAGFARLAVGDVINWRNNANSADLSLAINGSDQLTFGGAVLGFGSGITPIANGGTGQSTASAAINALLPSQGGNSGKFLTTNATSASWGTAVTSVTFTGDGTVLSSTPSSAVTTTGTVTAALATQSARYFLSGPQSGSAATPTFKALVAPTVQKFTSTGTTTGYLFTISTSTTCAVGDTYTNNSNTYTVLGALSAQSGSVLFMSGASAPTSSGTLSRATGSGTSSVTFSANIALATYTAPTNPAPLYIRARLVGAGGGGSGSGTAGGTAAGSGGTTYFGPNIIYGAGGSGAAYPSTPGAGGVGTIVAGASGTTMTGGTGGGYSYTNTNNTVYPVGGGGGISFFGGAPGVTAESGNGVAGSANSGSGGSGGGGENTASCYSGSGGGAGGFVDALIGSPAATYPYIVGAAGTAGGAGTNGNSGGAGAAGYLEITEYYQ